MAELFLLKSDYQGGHLAPSTVSTDGTMTNHDSPWVCRVAVIYLAKSVLCFSSSYFPFRNGFLDNGAQSFATCIYEIMLRHHYVKMFRQEFAGSTYLKSVSNHETGLVPPANFVYSSSKLENS